MNAEYESNCIYEYQNRFDLRCTFYHCIYARCTIQPKVLVQNVINRFNRRIELIERAVCVREFNAYDPTQLYQKLGSDKFDYMNLDSQTKPNEHLHPPFRCC